MRTATLALIGLTLASSSYLPLPQARAAELPKRKSKVVKSARQETVRRVNYRAYKLPVLNRRVLRFARRNLGRKFARRGYNRCPVTGRPRSYLPGRFTFMREALRRSGAWRPSGYYSACGQLIRNRANVLPGDIIWLKNVSLEGVNAEGEEYSSSISETPAIVFQVQNEHQFVIVQQYFTDKASQWRINLNHMKEGQVWFYRPSSKQP